MKKALLVGINTYKDSPLRGCVNDCLLMYKILSERFDFKPKNINLMTDYECTKKNIINSLKTLVDNSKSGDILYFHYSGHGSQVVVNDWTNSDEADGLDEIICPVNLDWNDPLRDNQLNKILTSTPKGVKIVVVLDCCHSGTGLRNSNNPKGKNKVINRFLPPPPSNLLSNPDILINKDLEFIVPKFNVNGTLTKKNTFLNETINQGDVILISGCQENQVSADAFMNGRFHGALTYTLAEVLYIKKFKLTNRGLVKAINKRLRRQGFDQRPQLECKAGYFDMNFLYV